MVGAFVILYNFAASVMHVLFQEAHLLNGYLLIAKLKYFIIVDECSVTWGFEK